MESMPGFERPESRKDLRQDVIDALREGRPDAQKLFLEWTIVREKEVEIIDGSHATIRLTIEQGDVCREAGLYEEAFDQYEAARTQAYNEKADDLFHEIEKKMDELEGLE